MYARNGFEFDDGHEFVTTFANANYVSATLT
jgi:hypothetical protein